VFHRVTDITALPGPVFFRLAARLPAYAGVMQARLRAEQDDGTGSAPAAAPAATPSPAPGGSPGAPRPGEPVDAAGRRIVAATREAMQADPELAGLVSFGTGGG